MTTVAEQTGSGVVEVQMALVIEREVSESLRAQLAALQSACDSGKRRSELLTQILSEEKKHLETIRRSYEDMLDGQQRKSKESIDFLSLRIKQLESRLRRKRRSWGYRFRRQIRLRIWCRVPSLWVPRTHYF